MAKVFQTKNSHEMPPTMWGPSTGAPSNGISLLTRHAITTLKCIRTAEHYSTGEHAHSALHYLLKQWVLTAKSDTQSLDLCTYPSFEAFTFPSSNPCYSQTSNLLTI